MLPAVVPSSRAGCRPGLGSHPWPRRRQQPSQPSSITEHSHFTLPGAYAWLYETLPDHPPDLCRAFQNTILHMVCIDEKTLGITHEQLRASGRQICVEFSCSSAVDGRCWAGDTSLRVEASQPSKRWGIVGGERWQ